MSQPQFYTQKQKFHGSINNNTKKKIEYSKGLLGTANNCSTSQDQTSRTYGYTHSNCSPLSAHSNCSLKIKLLGHMDVHTISGDGLEK